MITLLHGVLFVMCCVTGVVMITMLHGVLSVMCCVTGVVMITLMHGVLSVMCYRCSYDYIAAWCLICDVLQV